MKRAERNQAEVTRKGANRIRNGHLWIFKSDIRAVNAEGGTIVTVLDERRKFLGKAFYSDKSEIALRFLTTQDVRIDKNWWRQKISDSIFRRPEMNDEQLIKNSVPSDSSALRFIYSEGDSLPSLIVDFYNGIWVLQTLSQGTEKLKQTFVEIIKEDFQPEAIVERNDVKVREKEGLPLTKGVLFGDCPDEIVIEQNGVKFYVAPLGGQKTGAFLDQRENRLALRKYAFGRALDCFTFNGGFALNLAKTCDEVTAVDISEDAIRLARRNAELNQTKNLKFEKADVFDYLKDLETAGERFDTIVLDPPAFAKSRQSVESALRGYKEINLKAFKLLNRNGILATCTCSFHASEDLFLETVLAAANDAQRRVQLIEKRAQSSDHPILLGVPETYYLKCLILRVLD
ncbi:MAG: class I SAM-dependent rRNA methyltransferase [Acidobacteriota bacterium]|nr:class I SAM-dependent rRNA methyltransferase [Acidobacteriota bacterium]